MPKPAFVALHYGALVLFAVSCWGWGRLALGRLLRATSMEPWLGHGMCVCFGIGIQIVVLQLLGVAGLLTAPWLIVTGAVGLIAAAWQPFSTRINWDANVSGGRFLRVHWTAWLALILGLATTLLPLRPPHMWDELSFHLPHAQQWAKTGALQVNEWLRYPWSPLNFHLLFAAALVLYDDLMPHLLHALAGWLTALLLYQLAVRHTNRITACIAVILWLVLTRREYTSAYVDMAVAMFLLAGWIAMTFWREQAHPRAWLLAAAFLVGTAAGTKYQALVYLPLFAALLLLRDRRPSSLLMAFGACALPCAYWYVRNAVMTGDPFNPLGGKLFGFYDWNAADYAFQLTDLESARGWPSPWLWPAAAAPLLASSWRNPGLRGAVVFSAFAFAIWLLTSHFPRYLLPAYPLLLLLAAHVVFTASATALTFAGSRLRSFRLYGAFANRRVHAVIVTLLFLLALNTTSGILARDWRYVAATTEERDAFLGRQLWEFKEAADFLNRLHDARIYQYGMEGALYYAPHPIWGDHFGPWRYRDFMLLSPAELAAKLTRLNLNTLAVRIPFNPALVSDPDFPKYFEQLYRNHMFGIYRVRPGAGCRVPGVEPTALRLS